MRFTRTSVLAAAALSATVLVSGCSTAPKTSDQSAFIAEANAAKQYFLSHVPGLRQQIANSAGYVVYPSVGQWGIIFGGGKFGRGTVNLPGGTQVGWGAINVASVGLQAGVQGFKMLVVFQDKYTLEQFQQNKLTGSAGGVIVVGETGDAGTASFTNGVAVYQGAQTGLMAGVNIALDYMRYKPLCESD